MNLTIMARLSATPARSVRHFVVHIHVPYCLLSKIQCKTCPQLAFSTAPNPKRRKRFHPSFRGSALSFGFQDELKYLIVSKIALPYFKEYQRKSKTKHEVAILLFK
jgi:hypothetical protein